jgi:hypothetical protein
VYVIYNLSSGEYTPNCRFLKIINETRKGRVDYF